MAITRLDSMVNVEKWGVVAVRDVDGEWVRESALLDVTAIFAPDTLETPKKAESVPLRRPKYARRRRCRCQIYRSCPTDARLPPEGSQSSLIFHSSTRRRAHAFTLAELSSRSSDSLLQKITRSFYVPKSRKTTSGIARKILLVLGHGGFARMNVSKSRKPQGSIAPLYAWSFSQ